MSEGMTPDLKAFENWARTIPLSTLRYPNGSYQFDSTQWAWRGYQAHLSQPAQTVDAEPLRRGFMTAESFGPDALYLLKIKFQTLDDLQAAHNTLARALYGDKAGRLDGDDSAAVAAIQFALHGEEGMAFLRCWNEGDFSACRREWPEAPDACYVGADPAFPTAPSDGGKQGERA